MPIESAIKVTGTVIDNTIVKLGGLEIIPESIEVTNRADSPLPINDQAGIDQRLDWRFLDLRVPSRRLIFEVQTTVEKALRDFAYAQGCTELHTPKLMGTASESGAEEGDKVDLDPEGERALSALAHERHGHQFVFVTHFPVSVRPFYHLRCVEDPDLTASFDLLWRRIEITTGAQREHRHDVLCKQAEEKGPHRLEP